jgi:hypothetical protein
MRPKAYQKKLKPRQLGSEGLYVDQLYLNQNHCAPKEELKVSHLISHFDWRNIQI